MSSSAAGVLAKSKMKVWHPPEPPKAPSNQTVVAYLYRAQGGTCFHCLGAMAKHHYSEAWHPRGWTREHLVPKSKGGRVFLNIVLACNPCNNKRGDKDLPESEMRRGRMICLAVAFARRRDGFVTDQGPPSTSNLTRPGETLMALRLKEAQRAKARESDRTSV